MAPTKPLSLQLKRNLRRDILRGHPWVYKDALSPIRCEEAQLAKLNDHKGEFLAWGYADPNGVLGFRVLSTEKKAFASEHLRRRLEAARARRAHLSALQTDGFRLVNGEGDRLPGLVVDVYGPRAVLQFDGLGPSQFWDAGEVAAWLLSLDEIQCIYIKSRVSGQDKFKHLAGEELEPIASFQENGVKFIADLEHGQKTGFFFDQRDNRSYIQSIAKGCRVLNLFSYTGGFSIYAGVGGAEHVTSVDIAKGALEYADKSWLANDLSAEKHQSVAQDVFDFMSEHKEKWDVVIADPPSMASSEKHKEAAVKKYADVFAKAAKSVAAGGNLVLSSCSSHISFEDFFQITEQALSQARRTGLIQRVSGQGADHPFPHVCKELRYLKFFHLSLD